MENNVENEVAIPRVLLVDTNMLYSGIVYDGLEKRVLRSGKHIFITTESNISEIYRALKRKRGISQDDAAKFLESIPLIVVGRFVFNDRMGEAYELIGSRDVSDVPLIALALSFKNHDGIWTSDKDFDVVRHRFKIWKSRELA